MLERKRKTHEDVKGKRRSWWSDLCLSKRYEAICDLMKEKRGISSIMLTGVFFFVFALFQGGGLSDVKEGGLGPSSWGYPSVYHPYDPGFAAAAAAAAAAYPFNG